MKLHDLKRHWATVAGIVGIVGFFCFGGWMYWHHTRSTKLRQYAGVCQSAESYAEALESAGQNQEATEAYRRAVFYAEQYLDVEPENPEMQYQLAKLERILETTIEPGRPEQIGFNLRCWSPPGNFPDL